MTDSGYLSALDAIAHPHELVSPIQYRRIISQLVKEYEAIAAERTELLRRVNKKWWLRWI